MPNQGRSRLEAVRTCAQVHALRGAVPRARRPANQRWPCGSAEAAMALVCASGATDATTSEPSRSRDELQDVLPASDDADDPPGLGVNPESRTVDGLLCGPARLLRATPVGENEVAGLDPGEPWDETAARAALARRPAGGSRAEKSASCPFVGGVRARRARSGATMNVGDRTQAPVGRCRQPDPARHEQLPPNSGTPRTAPTSATRIRSGRS